MTTARFRMNGAPIRIERTTAPEALPASLDQLLVSPKLTEDERYQSALVISLRAAVEQGAKPEHFSRHDRALIAFGLRKVEESRRRAGRPALPGVRVELERWQG